MQVNDGARKGTVHRLFEGVEGVGLRTRLDKVAPVPVHVDVLFLAISAAQTGASGLNWKNRPSRSASQATGSDTRKNAARP